MILGDIKCIHFRDFYYDRGVVEDDLYAISKRANQVPASYSGKADALDKSYYKTDPKADGIGPFRTVLKSKGTVTGLCFGCFGEVSRSVKTLLSFAVDEYCKCSNLAFSDDMKNLKRRMYSVFRNKIAMATLRDNANLLRKRIFVVRPNAVQNLKALYLKGISSHTLDREIEDDWFQFFIEPQAGFVRRSR